MIQKLCTNSKNMMYLCIEIKSKYVIVLVRLLEIGYFRFLIRNAKCLQKPWGFVKQPSSGGLFLCKKVSGKESVSNIFLYFCILLSKS